MRTGAHIGAHLPTQTGAPAFQSEQNHDSVETLDCAAPVAPRAILTDLERTTIAIFDRVSPSVVQIAGQTTVDREQEVGIQSGTGFVWDPAGNVVTSDHAVRDTTSLAVRFSSGQVVQAEIVGIAANYDLAVIRVGSTSHLPPPISIGTSGELKVGQMASAIRTASISP
jgi:S1-C subfamily serine protease